MIILTNNKRINKNLSNQITFRIIKRCFSALIPNSVCSITTLCEKTMCNRIFKRFYPKLPLNGSNAKNPSQGASSNNVTNATSTNNPSSNDTSLVTLPPEVITQPNAVNNDIAEYVPTNCTALIVYTPPPRMIIPYVSSKYPVVFMHQEQAKLSLESHVTYEDKKVLDDLLQKKDYTLDSNTAETTADENPLIKITSVEQGIFTLLLFVLTLNTENILTDINPVITKRLLHNINMNLYVMPKKSYNLLLNELHQNVTNIVFTMGWDEKKSALLDDLNVFFEKYPIQSKDIILPKSRDYMEYVTLYSDKTVYLTDWEEKIKHFLSQEKYNVYRTPSAYEHNICLENNNKDLLLNYGELIYNKDEKVWHELIRRAGLTTNMDASATREEVDEKKYPNDYTPYNYPHIEGQGSKVIAKAYTIMNKNPEIYFDVSSIQLADNEKEALLDEIIHNPLIVATILRQNHQTDHLPYLSGDDLHCLTIVPFRENYIGMTTLTSTNDLYTYKFGDMQYANKSIQEQHKGEYCRPLLYLIHIDKNIVTFSPEHTDLVNNHMYNKEAIKDVFIRAIRDTYPMWKNNIIRKPISFTYERLNSLAIELCESRVRDLQASNEELKKKLKWDTLSKEERIEITDNRNKLVRNNLQVQIDNAYRKSLPPDIQKLFDNKKKLQMDKNIDYKKKVTLNHDRKN